jgi:uracil phosphoribosyltransferase
MDYKGLEVVDKKLQQSRERIEKRKKTLAESKKGLTSATAHSGGSALEQLTDIMFDRREGEEAFHPLSELELAVLENQIERYQKSGRFDVLGSDDIDYDYKIIRFNLLTDSNFIAPEEFRSASSVITNRIFDYVKTAVTERSYMKPQNTVVICIWRAGLAIADAAHGHGFYQFAHVGAIRDEETLAIKIYCSFFPDCIDFCVPENNRGTKVIIADPMLATGNTDISVIEQFKRFGFEDSNITILSVISAPEGVHHILSQFPSVKIITGYHDEKLNDRGYIVPGLGDFGDKWFEDLRPQRVAEWSRKGILTNRAERALLELMGFIPPLK